MVLNLVRSPRRRFNNRVGSPTEKTKTDIYFTAIFPSRKDFFEVRFLEEFYNLWQKQNNLWVLYYTRRGIMKCWSQNILKIENLLSNKKKVSKSSMLSLRSAKLIIEISAHFYGLAFKGYHIIFKKELMRPSIEK